ncbi:hypothetical protein C3729_07530 [Cloacibacterium normanense]|uniref:Uncharacterized protein n=1 Tax=Cloacibacterium normanense TaxID=237258 RepID=A0A2S7I5T6_9FLAO|nr:hypothetical protein [Cloacibacterium normanense]PPZ91899.1 hypothetical protein C3729_07530 [Cloacibacterium normanense]
MMKKAIIVFILLLVNFSLAQNRSAIDSLFQVKDYLLNVKHCINEEQTGGEKIAQLKQFIKLASSQEAIFERNATAIIKNKKELTQLKTTLHFILQSIILYHEDINQNGKSPTESFYLNKNIPPLVDKIYYYCKIEKLEEQKRTPKKQ